MFLTIKGEHTVLVLIRRLLVGLVLCWAVESCVAVKDAPAGKPYAFSTSVQLNAPHLGKEEKVLMTEKLNALMADSLAVPSRSVLGFTQKLSPHIFDSASIEVSQKYMLGFLNSEGFYHARFDTVVVRYDTTKRKTRFFSTERTTRVEVSTVFHITPGKGMVVDTVVYLFPDSVMQGFGREIQKNTLIKPGSTYSKQMVAAELDRLSLQWRQEGYFRMSRSALKAEVDTTDPSLVDLVLDPIEQQLQAQRRRDNLSARISIFPRPGADPVAFSRFLVDSVFIYPETGMADNPDSLIQVSDFNDLTTDSGKVVIREKKHQYAERLLRRANYLVPGSFYNDNQYYRTINAYSQMGPWQQLDVRSVTKTLDSLKKVDFHFFLYPARRQSFQLDLEGSQNNNISSSNVLAGRFLSVALAATHRSRNVWKWGAQSTLSGRAGLELNNSATSGAKGLFQSFITNVSQSFSLPKLLWPFRFLENRNLDFKRTLLNVGGTYTNRFEFFKQTALNASLVWEFRKGKNSYTFSFPNFETVDTVSTDSLNRVIYKNPSLAYSFTPGNVLSMRSTFERVLEFPRHRNHSGLFRAAAELTLPGNYRMFGKDFFKFFRLETQWIHHIKLGRNSIDFRLFAGAGWNLSGQKNANLPFIRQFLAGGSNSMRAWSIRQLGLGNSLANDTAQFKDRFGDIQLEWNLEFRHRLFRFFGYNLDGAVFTDIGNIWNHSNSSDGLGAFRLKHLYRDLAMATGYGIRWDLSFLVIRLDAAYKIKDPVREGAGWVKQFERSGTNRLGLYSRPNLALQFGIGYPF